jgi:TonB family protein
LNVPKSMYAEIMHKSMITSVMRITLCTPLLFGILAYSQCCASDETKVPFEALTFTEKRIQMRKELMEARPTPGTGEAIEHESVYPNPWTPFMNDLQKRILQQWHPVSGHEGDRTVVTFKVWKDGGVTDLKVIHPSGTPKVDEETIRAVKSAAPFSKLFIDGVHQESCEIQFTFPPTPSEKHDSKKSTFKGYI